MAESPLEAYLRAKGLPLPKPMDSFSAMRASLPQGPPPPSIGPASGIERVQNAVAEALGLPSWAPNLPEGSYGLPPSIGPQSAGQGLQDDILAAFEALLQQPAAQWVGVKQALGDKTPAYLGLPFDEQIGARFAEWGIPEIGAGNRLSPELLQEILRRIDLNKAMEAGTRSHYGLNPNRVSSFGQRVKK